MTSNVRFRVAHAGPYVSFQDAGRLGRCRLGVPASGPMDRLAHTTANTVLGNNPAATAVEVSRAGLTLDCETGIITIAVAGGGFTIDHDTTQHATWQVITVRAGEQVTVRSGQWGTWTYIAFAGDVHAPQWLGHTATHALAGRGGGMLKTSDTIQVTSARAEPERDGEIPQPTFRKPQRAVRIVLGPQQHHFDDKATAALLDEPFKLTTVADRMGVQLSGPALPLRNALSIPSEPIIRGSIQVTGDGVPTILFADHQTTGGYPKIAAVISADLDALTQGRPDDTIRFASVTPQAAVDAARTSAHNVLAYLDTVARPGRTLTQRLRRENLISWRHAEE